MSEPLPAQAPRELLDTMLGYLGFLTEIVEQEGPDGSVLQIYTAESQKLIGQDGETLDDLQYLLNRMIQNFDRSASRVTVDVEHHRAMRNDDLVAKARQVAEVVRLTGRPMQLEPMNSYDRRLIHNAFLNDPEIASSSPNDDARVKRISLKKRHS